MIQWFFRNVRKAALTIGLVTCCMTALAGNDNRKVDHLVPVNPESDKLTRSILYKTLFVTSGEFGRMLVEPPFDPEYSVAVHSTPGTQSNACVVTVTRVETGVSETVLGNKELTAIPAFKVKRADAEIRRSTADAVRRAWVAMIRNARPYPSNFRVSSDYDQIEYLVDEGESPLRAEMPSNAGSKALAMKSLGLLLVEYCDSEPSVRTKLAQKIEAKANTLLASLSSRKAD